MTRKADKQEIVKLFKAIQAEFPHLDMPLEYDHPHLDLNMDIPRQEGLAFDINVYLDGDELHLCAGCFRLEWFPCNEADMVEKFRKAVCGLLSGRYRIVEHYRGTQPVKAQLQRPEGNAWQTIGTYRKLHIPFPWHKTKKILQNVP